MRPPDERNPAGVPGFEKAQTHGDGLRNQYTTPALRNASARALEREISIILMAAHRVASGHGLHWNDYDRLHQAHQHVLPVLAALRGKEVLQ